MDEYAEILFGKFENRDYTIGKYTFSLNQTYTFEKSNKKKKKNKKK